MKGFKQGQRVRILTNDPIWSAEDTKVRVYNLRGKVGTVVRRLTRTSKWPGETKSSRRSRRIHIVAMDDYNQGCLYIDVANIEAIERTISDKQRRLGS